MSKRIFAFLLDLFHLRTFGNEGLDLELQFLMHLRNAILVCLAAFLLIRWEDAFWFVLRNPDLSLLFSVAITVLQVALLRSIFVSDCTPGKSNGTGVRLAVILVIQCIGFYLTLVWKPFNPLGDTATFAGLLLDALGLFIVVFVPFVKILTADEKENTYYAQTKPQDPRKSSMPITT